MFEPRLMTSCFSLDSCLVGGAGAVLCGRPPLLPEEIRLLPGETELLNGVTDGGGGGALRFGRYDIFGVGVLFDFIVLSSGDSPVFCNAFGVDAFS